ncbi:GlsB/YeaQ/YmgE family stress response membrane protein [Pantoea cypripedii]|jgi:uncharacterized membrane protein YeaQ/YmgE (transglycosylase-associated protein family)|uniref:GlsB/YeaQ/YmgE family stress response membrane protein n=1 Tax=Pantoea cypripedii TaxID=55209 RepID=A0A6B9FWS1_PANCY|nr:hypothetical protein [Pantoea cypripedii]QGY28292.1 hypothetical protein CUN67_04770 [Pantoea cypripedii]
MAFITWILTGIAVGWLKRVIFPGRPGGFFVTLVLTVIGALIGGYIASYFNAGDMVTLSLATAGMALAGALLMLLVVAKLRI